MPSDNKENNNVLMNANNLLSLDKRIDAIFPVDVYLRLKDDFQDQKEFARRECDSHENQFSTSAFNDFYQTTVISKLDEVLKVIFDTVSTGVRLDNNTKNKIAMIFKVARDFNFDVFKYFKPGIFQQIWLIVPDGET